MRPTSILRNALLGGLLLATVPSPAARLKDLASLRGLKENQLMGYGLVVGLSGTGDRGGEFTESSLNTVLKGLGIDLKTKRLETKNTAVVIVNALVPPFTKMGASLDVTVSSVGSASSLEGGTLLMTPLKGADGNVYAVAQGRIIVAKRIDRGTSAFQAMLSANIPRAAILERDVEYDFAAQRSFRYQLHQPDFTTSARIAQKVNEELGGKYATALDPGAVEVLLPYGLDENPVSLIAKIESLDVEPDRKAKVVINRRTGTVVLGDYVKIFPAAIAHNNIRIQIKEEVRDPNAAESAGPPQVTTPGIPEGVAPSPKAPRQVTVANRGPSIADIVTSLNEVGATADDLVFMLQALKSAGALVADLQLD